jgi:hypothetical protein
VQFVVWRFFMLLPHAAATLLMEVPAVGSGMSAVTKRLSASE